MSIEIVLKGVSSLVTKRFLGPFWYRRRWLGKTQWYSREQLRELQLSLLKKLILHCYKTVPYYHDIMTGKGILPSDIRSLEDIQLFPILTKRDILEAGNWIVSRKYPSFLTTTGLTGGTTGTPLRIKRDLIAVGNEHAFVCRQWNWAGLKLTDRMAYLSGRVVTSPDQKEGRHYAYDPFMRELILSSYHLSRETAPEFVDVLKRYSVKALIGYTSAIEYFAQLCMDMKLEVGVQSVLTTSETINETMRNAIQDAFGCKVYDFYGAAERVCYIFTCEAGSYHVLPEYGLTEFLPFGDGEKKTYKIVATGFWNQAMPLVRYDTQDIIELVEHKCSCGREFQVVKSIHGRTGDIIVTPSGRHFSPTLMARVSKMAYNILQTQIVQDRIDHLLIKYVPNSKFDDENLSYFKDNMRTYLPDELQLDFVQVDQVEKTASGKTNLVVSKLNKG